MKRIIFLMITIVSSLAYAQSGNGDKIRFNNLSTTYFLATPLEKIYSCGAYPVASTMIYDVPNNTPSGYVYTYVVDENGTEIGYCAMGGVSLQYVRSNGTVVNTSVDFCVNGTFKYEGSKTIGVLHSPSGGGVDYITVTWNIPHHRSRCYPNGIPLITTDFAEITINM